MSITDKLHFNNITFYLTSTEDNERTYTALDELIQYEIKTELADTDGVLNALVCESFRESDDDDMIRHFDAITGCEANLGGDS